MALLSCYHSFPDNILKFIFCCQLVRCSSVNLTWLIFFWIWLVRCLIHHVCPYLEYLTSQQVLEFLLTSTMLSGWNPINILTSIIITYIIQKEMPSVKAYGGQYMWYGGSSGAEIICCHGYNIHYINFLVLATCFKHYSDRKEKPTLKHWYVPNWMQTLQSRCQIALNNFYLMKIDSRKTGWYNYYSTHILMVGGKSHDISKSVPPLPQ